MTLIQIILYQNNKISEGNDNYLVYDFGKDYILPVLLATGAAYFAYTIFVLESRRDKEKEDANKKEEWEDKLSYLAAMIKSIIELAKIQNKNIGLYTASIKENPLKLGVLTWIPTQDIRRVNHQLNLEEYLLAYIKHFNSDRKETVAEFKKIIDCVDFFDSLFESTPQEVEKAIQFDYERRKEFQEIFKSAHKIFADLSVIISQINSSDANEMNNISTSFILNLRGFEDITYYHDNFMVPVNDFCVARLHVSAQYSQNILDLATLTRNGKQLYLSIGAANEDVMGGLIENAININSNTLELEKYSEKLLTAFNI